MKADGAYPVFGANGIIGKYDQFNHAEPQLLITCRGATCGSVNVSLPNSWITGNAMVVRPKDDSIDLRYLEYYFRGGIDISQAITGAAQPQITRTNLEPLTIQFPTSLEEQRRIVAVLDKAFAAIATATANAQKNQSNARALFDAELNAIFTTPGAGWSTKTMDEVAILTRGQNPPKSKFSYSPKDGYVRFFQIRDGKSEKNAVYVPESPQLHRVEVDDILMVAYRHVGRVFRGVSGAFNVALCKIQNRDRNVILDDYLYHIIPTDFVRGELLRHSERSLIPSMSVHHLKEILIPVPPIETQHEIVDRIVDLDKFSRLLGDVYSRKLIALAELKQSLLQKAFAGELTATAPQTTAPAANDNYATPMFTAQVIAFAQRLHEMQGKQQTFGHVKTQKALHLVESVGGIDLGRQPIKDAAGPNDFQHMLRATDWAVQQGFFEFAPRANGKGYDFKRLANYDALWAEAEMATQPVSAELSKAIGLIVDSDSDFAELIATTHAAWNNLIIDGAEVSDNTIVLAARDNWHEKKKRHDPSRFHDAIHFIRSNNIIPDGSAKYVGGQGSLL